MKPCIAFCDICGKKLKGSTPHGLATSRAMHYKKSHQLTVLVVENQGIRALFKHATQGSTT